MPFPQDPHPLPSATFCFNKGYTILMVDEAGYPDYRQWQEADFILTYSGKVLKNRATGDVWQTPKPWWKRLW